MKLSKRIAFVCAAVMTLSTASALSVPAVIAADSTQTATGTYTAKYALSNKNANDITKRTYDFINDNFEQYIISCQQESTWMGSVDYEMNYIKDVTGKFPAMRGLDFMHDDFLGVVDRSKDWWEKGGLVTICWHCGVNGKGYNEAKDDNPDFDKLLTPGTDEYNGMIKSWDKAAAALQKLEDAGVPVFWRPFHEFDGQWFWWGKGGADNFVKLWRMMYDYFTEEKGLDNLIWVLGYADYVKDGWYPGDDYCDVIGSDTYNNTTNIKAWKRLKALNAGKPLAFHECGNVPSVAKFNADGDIWSWFMVWHTDHITNNDKDNLKAVYNSKRVITLDEMPDMETYTSKTVTYVDDGSDGELITPMKNCSMSIPATSFEYTGSAIKPTVTVKDDYGTLKEGTHYTVSFKNNTNIGTATVTVTGKGNYTGSTSMTFKIKAADISKAKVGSIANKVYTGKAIKPAPTVKLGSRTLKNGTDYTLSYKDNKSTGKATVTVTGKGNYTGTVSKTFKIVPKKTSITKLTSPKTKTAKVKYKKMTGATGYQVAYSTSSKFTKSKTKTASIKGTTKTLKSLKKGKTYYVKVRAYKTVGKVRYYGAYSKVKKIKIK